MTARPDAPSLDKSALTDVLSRWLVELDEQIGRWAVYRVPSALLEARREALAIMIALVHRTASWEGPDDD